MLVTRVDVSVLFCAVNTQGTRNSQPMTEGLTAATTPKSCEDGKTPTDSITSTAQANAKEALKDVWMEPNQPGKEHVFPYLSCMAKKPQEAIRAFPLL